MDEAALEGRLVLRQVRRRRFRVFIPSVSQRVRELLSACERPNASAASQCDQTLRAGASVAAFIAPNPVFILSLCCREHVDSEIVIIRSNPINAAACIYALSDWWRDYKMLLFSLRADGHSTRLGASAAEAAQPGDATQLQLDSHAHLLHVELMGQSWRIFQAKAGGQTATAQAKGCHENPVF